MMTGGAASDPSDLRSIRILTANSCALETSAGTSHHCANRDMSAFIQATVGDAGAGGAGGTGGRCESLAEGAQKLKASLRDASR
jgi:hypothetical protein